MHTRTNISFKSDGLTLRGWLYTPNNISTPTPAIIMSHGFSCLKEHALDQFASAFANKGFTVLAYDNRNFGDSDGSVKLEVDPAAQVQDLKNAISFMQTLKGVNANEIGFWGASLGAGVALATAAKDRRVKCLCLQAPKVGDTKEKQEKVDYFIEKILQKNHSTNPSSVMIQVTAINENELSLIHGQQAYDFFTSVDSWQNNVTLSSLKNTSYFSANDYIDNVKIPSLFIVVDDDKVVSTKNALKAYEELTAPKEILQLQGEHFSPWLEHFDVCCEKQIEWFKKYLL